MLDIYHYSGAYLHTATHLVLKVPTKVIRISILQQKETDT